jgi:hypothetical protein
MFVIDEMYSRNSSTRRKSAYTVYQVVPKVNDGRKDTLGASPAIGLAHPMPFPGLGKKMTGWSQGWVTSCNVP